MELLVFKPWNLRSQMMTRRSLRQPDRYQSMLDVFGITPERLIFNTWLLERTFAGIEDADEMELEGETEAKGDLIHIHIQHYSPRFCTYQFAQKIDSRISTKIAQRLTSPSLCLLILKINPWHQPTQHVEITHPSPAERK